MLALHSYFRSSCSWRVRLVLQLKAVQYEYRAVNLLQGQQLQPTGQLAQLNPMLQVPALELEDGQVLTQSSCIVEYLEERYEQRALLPADRVQRARVRQICAIIGSGVQPLQNLSVLRQLAELVPGDADVKRRWGAQAIERGFQALEALLAGCAGRCCVGDDVTLADCFLVPQVYNAGRFQVDMQPFPLVRRVCEHLEQLPEFQAAHPSQQPDCPPELR